VIRANEQRTLAAMSLTKSAFQAWSLVCRSWPGNERRCVLFIAVAEPEERRVLLTFSIARTPRGMPVLLVDTPGGAVVAQGVTLTAGVAEPVTVPIQSCDAQRCRAITELTSSLRSALEAADVTSVTYVRADGRQSTYNLPTRGFRDGMVAWLAGSELPSQPVSAAVN
jgi:invasion protein IalB